MTNEQRGNEGEPTEAQQQPAESQASESGAHEQGGQEPSTGTQFTPPQPSDPLQSAPLHPTTPLQSTPYNVQQPPQSQIPPVYASPQQQMQPGAGYYQTQGDYVTQGGYPGGPTPPPPPGGPAYPAQQPGPAQSTNTLAIVALISSFFISILGIILGHIALSQIKKTGEGGRGLALAGTIIGYVFTAIAAISLVVVLLSTFFFLGITGAAFDEATKEFQGLEELDDSQENYTFDDPWVGTEHEEYCNAFMNFELLGDNPEQYYEEIAELTPNPENAEIFKKYAQFMADPTSVDSSELDLLLNSVYDIEDEVYDLCYDY